MEGHVDGWDGGHLRGWAWEPEDPAAALVIEIVSEAGEIVADTSANIFRGDLANAGKRHGACSYFVAVPPAVAGPVHVFARLGDAVWELAGSPIDRPNHAPVQAFDNRLSDGTGLEGYLDEVGPHHLRGWIHDGTVLGPAIDLEVIEEGRCIARGRADRWREDLEDFRQGNGRVGYRIALPPELYDGEAHRLMLRRADTQADLLATPATIRLDGPAPVPQPRPEIRRPPADRPIDLSIVVNFYNMRREAERTLHSLSRAFQRDVEDIAYEVICIDNGSSPPLDQDFVESFGPEFRLLRPADPQSSPVFVLNEGAALARGHWLAMMIDGAHLLSPGALTEAVAALRSEENAIVALRQWFVGGDQRWFSTVGYGGTYEDILFSRIEWPDCGYDIFDISAPVVESASHWFDGMSETNCLFIKAEAYRAIGGFDEAFSMPGGGFANLDLFVRAARAPGAVPIALIGEASFHQYHGGTTTNVSDAEKDIRVRNYVKSFEALRGRSFAHLDTLDIRLRGQIRTKDALVGRRPPVDRTRLGLTGHIKPAGLIASFDPGMRSLARAAYVEADLHERTTWAGQGTGVAPADLVEIQQMLWSARPDVLICKNVAAGLVGFVASILPALGLASTEILWITAECCEVPSPLVRRIVGDAMDGATLAAVEDEMAASERCCVLFQPRDDELMPLDAIRRYARFVSAGEYLVVLGGAFGQPDIGYSNRWTARAIEWFLRGEPYFERDHTLNAHLISTCPSGFLRRIPNVHIDLGYDPALDDLEGL